MSKRFEFQLVCSDSDSERIVEFLRETGCEDVRCREEGRETNFSFDCEDASDLIKEFATLLCE